MAGDEVGELGVRLSIDGSDFNRPLASIERNLKSLGGELATVRARGADWGKSMEGLGQRQEVLGRTLSTQEAKVRSLREAYDKSAREKGRDAAATENLAAKLQRAISEYTRTETELNQVNSALADQQAELAHAESAWGRLESSLDSASGRLEAAGEISRNIGEKLTVGLTTPILGAGAAALKIANDFDVSQGKMQAQLGLTAEEAEKLHGTAESLWKNAFGESIGGVADDLALIKQNMHGITGDQLESVAEKAYILQDAFGAELISTTKTAQTMMTNFGITADEAFDLMTRGFQEGGNYSDELLDTLNEYSPQFSTMGHSAKDMMNILIAGAEAGAFNLDKVGDAVKEFNIRAKDGSDATADGFKAIGLNAKDMGSAIAQGGEAGTKAFQATIAALAAMEDPVEQTAAGVALFGTQWEDLESGVIEAMGTAKDQLGEVEGATKAAGDALYDNLGSRATSVFRDFQSDLEPAGEILVELAEDILPKVADTVGDLTEKFAEMSPEAQENALMIAGIAAAAGPAFIALGTMSSGLSTVVKAGSGLAGMLGKAGGSGMLGRIGLMGVAGGPVGLAIAGVGALSVGLYGLNEASEASKEVNLEHAESLIEQQQSLEGLIGKYEVLAEKNKLSNDELLLFRDIQSDMDTATSAEEVAALAEQAGALQEKSGLTNEELQTMLTLNDQLIEKVPTAGTEFSKQGEQILSNAEDLHIANDALRESIELELQLQQTKAEAKLGEDINARIEAQKELNNAIRELNNEQITMAAKEYQLSQLKKEQQAAYAAGQDEIAIGMESEILNLQTEIGLQNDVVGAAAAEALEKEKSLSKSDAQIAKTQALYDKFINLQLASAGINAEGEKGIAQLNDATAKTAERVRQLNLAKQSQGGLTAEQQTELNNLNEALGMYRNTKTEIQNIQGEQGAVNQKIDEGIAKSGEISKRLSASEIKEISFTGDGLHEAQIISDEASKDVQKEVDVTDYGKANSIHNESEKDAHKSVFVKVIQTAGNIIRGIGNILGFAHGTDNHKGGPALVGDGVGSNAGRELINLPDGRSLLSPATPTIMDLPKGTSVLSATKTRKLLGHVPKYAKGTPDTANFDIVNYDRRLKAVADGSGVAKMREIRAAEIASLEAQIEVLTKEGATIKQLSQAKEMEARLSKLQAQKAQEYASRIREQQITIEALNKAYRNKKITLAEYNKQVASATSEIHSLKAEQLAFNEAQKKGFDEALSNQTRIRTVRQSNIELLTSEIEHLTREGATVKELNLAKQKQAELNRLNAQKEVEYTNKLKDQQKVINDINAKKRKGLLSQEQYNKAIADATVEMNDLKMESLAFYESLSEAQEKATIEMRENLAGMLDDMANSQIQAFETAVEKQLQGIVDKNRKAEDLFKEETAFLMDELKRQKEAALDSFDAQTEAHEKSIERQIENINKRRDAELQAIDEQLAALEKQEKAESRDEVEGGWTKEQTNLAHRLTAAEFMKDEETVKAVLLEQADLEEAIRKQRLEWEREDLKESLKLQQDQINETYDLQETALEEDLKRYSEQRDLQRDALEAQYELRAEQFEAMREQQLEALELEHQTNLEAAERELELQKQRFEELQKQLVQHVENGTLTQKQANAAWMQAVKDLGIEQVYQEIENQEKSKAALDKYVDVYLGIGKSYGNNLVNGVVSTLNSRLSEVRSAASKIQSALAAASASPAASIAARSISQTTPMAVNNTQPIIIQMDGEEIAAYSFNHVTGAMRQVSRKG